MKYLIALFMTLHSITVLACSMNTPIEGIAECKYQRFTAWVNCADNANLMSWFELTEDSGSQDTSSRNYKLDGDTNLDECQQSTDDRYNSDFDVGHIAAIDHFDESTVMALETNFMTNLLPQASKFNRHGAWRKSERMTDCYRDEEGFPPLLVMAGPIYGNDTSNDVFSSTHELNRTPDYYWKVVYSVSSKKYDAWIMPNHNSATSGRLPDYRVSLEDLVMRLLLEKERAYFPVIGKVADLLSGDPSRFEMKNNPRCHDRRG